MVLENVINWLIVAFLFVSMVGLVGIGLAKFLVLTERVYALEYWFAQIEVEPWPPEQDDAVLISRQNLEGLCEELAVLRSRVAADQGVSDDPGEVASWRY